MFKYVKDQLRHLHAEQDGVVSFEYVIVAACIVASVALAFGTTATGGIGSALTTGIAAVTTAFTAAI